MDSWKQLARCLNRGATSGPYWCYVRDLPQHGLARSDRRHLEINGPIDHGASDAAGEALFVELAAKRQVSESALALVAIRALLDSVVPDLPPRTSSSNPAIDRITIRLRPGDRLAIRQRAAERRMKDSAYIAALVRGHLAANPPLATHELAAIKAAGSVLAAFGRILARTARDAAQGGLLPPDLQQDLCRSRALVSDVERRTHEFAQAALVTGRAALTRRVVRLPSDGPRFFEVVSYGRADRQMPVRFSPTQIDQISRTVRHTPEVMVKVTGGGTRRGAVAAHFEYISRGGTLEIKTDEGERIGRWLALGTHRWSIPAGEGRSRAPADETRSQHRAFHAGADATGQGVGRRAAFRPAEIRATPLRHGLAHPPAAPARAPGGEGRERARPAAAHRQGVLA